MGFGPGASAEALRQANNDVSQALEVSFTKFFQNKDGDKWCTLDVISIENTVVISVCQTVIISLFHIVIIAIGNTVIISLYQTVIISLYQCGYLINAVIQI